MPDLDPRIILAQRQLPSIADMQDEQQKRQIQQQEVELRRQEIMARRDAIVQQAMLRGQKAAPKPYDPKQEMEAQDLRVKQAVMVGNLLEGATDDDSYEQAKQGIAQIVGPDYVQHLPQTFDPAANARLVAQGKALVAKTAAANGLTRTEIPDPTDPTKTVQTWIRPTENMQLPVPSKAATAKTANLGSFEDYVQRTYGAEPTSAQILEGRKKYNQSDDRPRITVNAGGIGANIPGDFDKTGEDFLKTVPKQWQSTVRKIANYDEDPTKVASMRGGLRETLMTWVNQVNPAYDQSQFALRSPTRRAFTIGTQGQQINAINTAIGHIDQLTTLSTDLQNGGFTPANKAWNTIRSAFGSDKVTNFDTLKDALSGEVASVLSKSGATVSGIAEAKEKINAANSPTQLAGYVKTLIPIMGSKLAELNYQYHQAMGADDTYSALSPQSKAILTKHGFDPEKPEIGAGGAPRPAAPAAAGRVRVVGPEGQTGTVPVGTTLPPGWRKQ